MRISRWSTGILALCLCSVPAWTQVTASISGTVEDASHSPVGGASVNVKSLETGAARSVVTNENGQYRVTSLHLGPQEVKVEKTGFRGVVRTGVNLGVGEEAVVNVQLEVGEVVESIAVSEQAPIVNTTTASTAGVVSEQQVKDLPLNGRSFDNLITLNPGVINYSAMKSANTSTSDGNTFTVAGRRTGENLFLLNGVEYTGSSQLAITPGGTSGYLLGIDAVREFSVMTDTYSAEYGKRAGAQVNVVTQSGSNTVHGTLFEFLRNSALDARSAFAQTSFTPPFRQNQFGGAIGGPLKKDRWFLFGNYEGYRQAQTLSSVSVVPDAQARLGLLPNSSGVYAPVANLDTRMLPYTAFWPVANGPELMAVQANGSVLPSGTAFSYNNPRQSIHENFGTTRSDYMIGDHDWFSAAYTIDDGDSLIPLADPNFASATALRSQVASVQESHVFSPRRLNNFTAGFSRAGFQLSSSIPGQVPNLSFVNGAGPGGIVVGGGITTTGGNNTITSAGPNNAAGVWNRRNLYTVADTYQIMHGRHQISFGGWFQRVQDNEDTASRQLGQATFTSLTTFLQGTVSSFQAVPSANELGWRSLFGAWYVQDAFKVRRNLTIQAGIRHEFTTGWNEVAGRAANYIPDSSGTLQTAPRVGDSVFTQNNAKKLFGPRVSVAWDVFGNGRTAVHAGFGTYYSLIDDLSFLLNSLPPYNGALTYTGSLFSFTPIAPGATPPPTCGPGVPAPCSTYAPQGIQADAKTPAVAEWRFTVEQQLTRQMALRVAYVGSHGYHGLLSIDPNTVAPLICTAAASCTAGGTGAARSTVAQGTQYIPVVPSRPNPYLGAGFFWYTEGNSSYNALEVDVNRRFSRGLEFRANYTWSKNLDMNSGLTGAQAQNQAQMILNRFNPRMDWGPSALNVRQQAGLSLLYELPFGRGKQWQDRIIGGWQVNAIATLLSGFPFTPQIGSNRSGDGDTRNPDRPSVNPAFAGPVILGKQGKWYDPNAFVLPAVGTFGNVGRGVYEGPGMSDLDVSLFKRIVLTEKTSLQFRAEFFNVMNHVNLGTPNATVFSGTAYNAAAGLITTLATTPRQIQFGLKLTW